MELWNRKDISMPPINSVKMKKADIDIVHLKSIFNSAMKVMEEKHLLHKEGALLSRYIYRVQRTLRGQKGIMYMYKVNRGLKRYISLDIQHVYRNFSMMLSYVDDCNDECIYVPTKQMLQYVLVRTQGFCKVMNYLSIACQDAAMYYRGILRIGHCIPQNLLSLSMVSRIWYCTRYFMICACQWYDQLLPYLEKLKIKGPCWLPTEYELPGNLGTWLGPDPITGELKYDVDTQKISQEISQIEVFKDLGTLVNRKDFLARRNEKASMPLGISVKMGVIKNNDKLLTADLDAVLMSHNVNLPLKTKNKVHNIKLLENGLSEQISCDQLLTQKVKNESAPVAKNVFNTNHLQGELGEPISRDQFLAQKAKKKSICMIGDELTKTSCDFQSKNVKPNFRTTTRYHCNSSFEDSADIPEESVRNDQSPLLGIAKNNTGEMYKFVNSKVTGRKSSELEKVLHTPLKLSKSVSSNISEIAINTMKSCKNTNKEIKISLANNCLSQKALTNAFHSSDDSQVKGSKLFLKKCGNSKRIDFDNQKKYKYTSLDNKQMKNKFVQNNQFPNTLKGNEDAASIFEFNTEQVSDVSEGQQQCAITSRSLLKKKNKNSLGSWEIINGIRTLKEVKEFLHSEKKARAKGKSCVTSKLNHSEWIVLFEAINKFFKKKSVSKLKGNKKMKKVMEEIRNTLISFVI